MIKREVSRLWVLLLTLTLAACGPSPTGTGNHNGNGGGDGAVGDGSLTDGAPGDGFVIVDAAPTDALEGCDPQNFTLQQAPPAEVYLVIDKSGSMLEPGSQPGLTRWDELNAAVDFALTQFEGSIRFGLLMYPFGDECSTSGPQVGVDLFNRDAVLFHLGNTAPNGGTPTAAALNNASSSLVDLGSIDSPKFLVLATDGGPNCNYFLSSNPACTCTYSTTPEYCCTSYPDNCVFGNTCLDDTESLNVITNLHDNLLIDTFVIGLAGTAEYEPLLNAMAIAGGRPQQGGATDYYSATNQAELQAALQAIAVSVISCVIDLAEAPVSPDLVRIYMDGQEIQRDGSNGWQYTDPTNTQIELYGTACDLLQDGDEHTLTATFGCVVD